MPLEANFRWLDDLVVANPDTDDEVNEGDNHLRGIKSALAGSITGNATETRMLGGGAVSFKAVDGGAEVIAPATEFPVLTFKGLADTSVGRLGFPAGTIDMALHNDSLLGVLDIVLSVLAAGDVDVATFSPGGMALKAEAEDGVTLLLESQAGVNYLQFSGAPASAQLIDVMVESQNLTARGLGVGSVLKNLWTADPDSGVTLYWNGAVSVQTIETGMVMTGVTWTTGIGSPEGVVTAGPGSMYCDRTSGSARPFWTKNFSGGNTGWITYTAVGP